jgi:hypothetical protein
LNDNGLANRYPWSDRHSSSHSRLQTAAVHPSRTAGNSFDMNFSGNIRAVVLRNENNQFTKLSSRAAIGLGKLDFGGIITDDGNMSYPDWIGAQYGNWLSADFMSFEPSTLSFLLGQFHCFHLLI